jgi:DNA ligase D-like protein (predicted 3'-phosphoesterase)
MPSLKLYQQKRKFNQTPEPKGQIKKTNLNRFVVHEHWATHHHYDFRLELDGVLKSWAIPKEIPQKVNLKRLAVQVEDHPIEYINFEGIIPEGNYGAGKVKIWDKGKFEILERSQRAIKFILSGKKLKGRYILYKFKNKNWLIFKENDSSR